MPGTYIPAIPPQFLDNNGAPAAGYLLFTYASGTTTKQSTYSDADLTTANANPIVLDSAGRATIFLAAQNYKFVLATAADTDPPASPVWTRDGVAALAAFNVNVDVAATAGEALSFAEVCFLADGAGGLQAGKWYKANATDGHSSVYAPVLGFPTANFGANGTGTIRIAGRVPNLSSLAVGSRYYVSNSPAGALTSTRLPNMRTVGHADSSTSLILEPQALTWKQLNITIGTPGGGVLTTGVKRYLWAAFPFIVTGWSLFAEQSGSIVIDIWSDTYANFPPTVADTIAGSSKPTLSAAQKNQNLAPSFGTFLVPRDNVLAFNIDSVATVNYVSLTLEILTV